ncbi:RING finger protein 25, variant 2 [Schistosoma haematobium]|uniref:RING finger protein 25, variant 2 n=1 Tax=Schistosoma haematobium TaxID=6185 RepID=A0A922INZ6_SCHHA|nr:RING finger protein 25, variant 2 [Schistosoma haematobium]KAH9583736.1 RING finger protein 25, variant 2 [Schistosoma haematobium]
MDNIIQDELQLLYEMFPGEFKVDFDSNQYTVTFVVTPGVGFNNPVNKFIKFNLNLNVTLKYPIESPTVSVECVHGLKEKDIAKLLSLLRDLTLERNGDAVIFDLVDVRKFIID